jgi:hypothetical protein
LALSESLQRQRQSIYLPHSHSQYTQQHHLVGDELQRALFHWLFTSAPTWTPGRTNEMVV